MNQQLPGRERAAIRNLLDEFGVSRGEAYLGKDFKGSEFKDSSYEDEWKSLFSGKHFDFLLADYSFFQFEIKSAMDHSFRFYQCPFIIEPNDEAGEAWADAPKRSTKELAFVRYDYAPHQWNDAVHPVAHFHIGSNDIRIQARRMMTSKAFVLFILRHFYSNSWKQGLTALDKGRLRSIEEAIRDSLREIVHSSESLYHRCELELS